MKGTGNGIVSGRDVIVIGGSAGGIEAVKALVGELPADLPAAVFLVIHISAELPSALPSIIDRAGALPARHAVDGETIEQGRIYVAPPNCHMLLEHGHVRLTAGPRENRHRPALDPLFRSAASVYGSRVLGVVLSGGRDDGTAGLLAIKREGGIAVVQDPGSAICLGMPQSAIEHVAVDHIVEPQAMARLLVDLAGQPAQKAHEARGTMAEKSTTVEPVAGEDRERQPGEPSTQTCPECHGKLWEGVENHLLEFRCGVGHAYTAEALAAHQAEQLEVALGIALRALEEHQALARRLARRASRSGRLHVAASFTERAVDAEHNASVIRAILRFPGDHPPLAGAEPRRKSG